MKGSLRLLRRFWEAGVFSPEAFVLRAAIISVLYFVSRIAGLQEYTAFLSGTSANLNMTWENAAVLGLIHLLLHVFFILLVPICLITAGLLAAWNRWTLVREIEPHTIKPAAPGHELNQKT